MATFLGAKLFRWDKDEKLRPQAKLWVLAVLAPFLAMGLWQAHSKTNIEKEKILARDLNRNRTLLLRDVRLFTGNGQVMDDASVLIKEGKIVQVFSGSAPEIGPNQAEVSDGAGKTLLPGFIDTLVHLQYPGLDLHAAKPEYARELAAHLYCGVTSVRQVGDTPAELQNLAAWVQSGGVLGAEVIFGDAAEKGNPNLSYVEAVNSKEESLTLLDRPLVQQVTARGVVQAARENLTAHRGSLDIDVDPRETLLSAYRSGEPLVIGSDAGAFPLAHGPTLHRELQLWVAAGIPPAVALQAATYNAARLLHQDQRIGLVKEGYDANLLLVEGNPLQDIAATEHISAVIFHGERIDRGELLKQK